MRETSVRLPLDDDEAVAAAIGLQSGAIGPMVGIAEPALRALARLRRLMPARLRDRVDRYQSDVLDHPPTESAAVLATLALLCRGQDRLSFDYPGRDGSTSRREVEPHRFVRTDNRWCLVAWDLDRRDWRTFRIDRMTLKTPGAEGFVPRRLPDGGAPELLADGMRGTFTQARARIRVAGPADRIGPLVPAEWGTVRADGEDACVVTLRGESLSAVAPWLAMFDAPFTVLDPPELRAACHRLAQRYTRLAARYADA